MWLEHETLHAHTSHTWQLLSVNCFKPFKVAFKKERNNDVANSNHSELDKTTLGPMGAQWEFWVPNVLSSYNV